MSAEHRRPVLAGAVAIGARAAGGGIGYLAGWMAGAPHLVVLGLAVTGYVAGYLAGREILRRLFVRWL